MRNVSESLELEEALNHFDATFIPDADDFGESKNEVSEENVGSNITHIYEEDILISKQSYFQKYEN